jgi:Na+-driven multidrug efflux pump
VPSICLFTVISAILCFVMVVFAQPIAVLMQSPEEAVDLTASYIRICGAGIFFIVAYNVISAIFRGLGLTASSGYGVASKIVSFVMLVPSSLMQSMSSFISQNVGAKREDRARKAMVFGMLFAFAIGVCINLIYFIIFSRQLKNNNTSG